MADSKIMQANERYKAVAGALINLGTGLFAAAVVAAYAKTQIGVEIGLWFIGAFALTWCGWMFLGLIESEH